MYNSVESLYNVTSLSDYHLAVWSRSSLIIPYDLWKIGYDYDVSPFVERNVFKEKNQQANKEIKYLSWAHAYRIFKQLHPNLNVAFIHDGNLNPALKQELSVKDGLVIYGYYCLGYIYDPDGNTTPLTYYPFMNTSNGPLLSTDLDRNGNPTAHPVRFNLNIMRALTKVIAIHTGIGLKLWTDEDLDPAIAERKIQLIDKIKEKYHEYLELIKTSQQPDKFFEDMEIVNRDSTMLTQDQLLAYGKKLSKLVSALQVENT